MPEAIISGSAADNYSERGVMGREWGVVEA